MRVPAAVVEETFAEECWYMNRILGASFVRYSTGEFTPAVNCISGQCTGCIMTYWGKVKLIETGQV